MAFHRVDLRTYLRILSCALVGGFYAAIGVPALLLFLNPAVPTTPNVLAHLFFYLVPVYGVLGTAAWAVPASLIQPFVVRPLARRLLDPMSVSWILVCDLAVLAGAFWLNHLRFDSFLSPRQHAHLLRGAVGLTLIFALALTAHAFQYFYPARRRGARLALLLLGVVGGYFPYAQRRPAFTPERRHTLVLDLAASGAPLRVLAIDGLALRDLRALEAAGRLPSFSRLLSGGTSIPLRTLSPCEPPVVLTTVATGKLPWRHGVADAHVFGFPGLPEHFRIVPRYLLFRTILSRGVVKASPVMGHDRDALPFWNLLSRGGMSVGVVNWPVSYPADALRGFVVSDYLTKPYFQFGTALSRVTYPDRLAGLAVQHRVRAGDIPDALVEGRGPLADVSSASADELDRLRQILKGARAADLTTRAMGHLFEARYRPQVMVLRFEGLAMALRYFLRFHRPEAFGDVPPDLVQRHGKAIEGHYAFLDGILAEQLQALPAGGRLAVVSAAGTVPLTTLGRALRFTSDPLLCGVCSEEPEGLLILYGDGVPAGTTTAPRHIADVAPTLLYGEGMPVARDMDGEPIFEAFTDAYKSRTPATAIASYEAARMRGPRRAVTKQPMVPVGPPAPL